MSFLRGGDVLEYIKFSPAKMKEGGREGDQKVGKEGREGRKEGGEEKDGRKRRGRM